MAELTRPIHLGALILYLNSKFEEDKILELKTNYLVDLTTLITKAVTNNRSLKTWTELENKLTGSKNKDKRTAKQIEDDILSKFKNLGEQG